MNIIFFFILYYSAVYVKYTYCLEAPENMTLHYFDGTDWVTVKPRNIEVKPEVSRPINITQLLNWERLSKLFQPIELETTLKETTTKKPPTKPTTKPTTTKRTTTKPTATKTTTTKTTKRTTVKTTRTTTPKTTRSTKRRLKFITKRTILVSTIQYISHCKYNLCNEIYSKPTTKHKKVYKVWKRIQKKPTVDSKYITNPTTPFIPRWIIQEVTTKKFTFLRNKKETTKTPKTTTRTTTKATTRTTKRSTTRTTTTKATTTPKSTTKPITKNPGKSNMNMTEFPTLPKNWMELMKEFVKTIKSVNKTTMCERSSLNETTIAPFNFPLSENKKEMTNVEDFINILNDGVEIDDGLVEDVIEKYNPLRNFKEIESTVIDTEKPLSEKVVFTRNITSTINTSEKEDDAISRDAEIAAYINVFINRYVKTHLTSQPQHTTLQYNDVQALLDIIHGKMTPKEFLRTNDEHQRNVAIKALVENIEVQNSLPEKISRTNSETDSSQLLKEHRNHWKKRDIRKYLNKIKETFSEKDNKEQTQNFSPTPNKAVPFASSNKINVDSNSNKELLVNKDVQLLFSTFVMFLMKNITADAQTVTKPMKKTKEVPKLDNRTLQLIQKLNEMNPLLTKFRSDSKEIKTQPLFRSNKATDELPIKHFFADNDDILNYDKEDYERYDTEGIEMDLTEEGLGNKDRNIG
ncbi:unnamed protein product [Spodoptera littoralis]|uniref:Zonadhesin n=1 Tax=Spodoptera littoralis TaxID=7109 RepID=A0A9P0N1M7_SPOLI|nr:unnamed protein product [Spodoptera littoralis]CAH1639186.1 unnamed protein product [Spodoptera littoralis]